MNYEVGVKSDIGRVRTENEDSFYVNPNIGLFMIADGMGGHQGGEIASRIAVETISQYFEKSAKTEKTIQDLEQAIYRANDEIYLQAIDSTTASDMGTTVIVAKVEADTLFLSHVGDSRAYLLTKDGLERMTQDHAFKQKKLPPGYGGNYPKMGAIYRALGKERYVEIDSQEVRYQGETLLLCSDGLSDLLEDNEIEQILLNYPDAQEACNELVRSANDKGGYDNITVIIGKQRNKSVG